MLPNPRSPRGKPSCCMMETLSLAAAGSRARINLRREIMDRDRLFPLIDEFKVETPSWGYADTGTRFGKFFQPAAANTIDDKLADAGAVHKFTGCCPTVAVHVLWDFSVGVDAT